MIDRLKVKCPDCKGTKISTITHDRRMRPIEPYTRDCPICHGSGEVPESDSDYIARLKVEAEKWQIIAMKMLLPMISDSDIMTLLNELTKKEHKAARIEAAAKATKGGER